MVTKGVIEVAPRFYAWANPGGCLWSFGRGTKHHCGADEDVSDTYRPRFARGGDRRPFSGGFASWGSEWLAGCLDILRPIDEISMVHFTDVDVVRHPLVSAIVRAYARAESKKPK